MYILHNICKCHDWARVGTQSHSPKCKHCKIKFRQYFLYTLHCTVINSWATSSEFGTYGAVSPEPPLLAHTSSESRGTFRQKARSLAPLNGWACAVKICHDGMLEDKNSLDAVQLIFYILPKSCLLGKLIPRYIWAMSWENLSLGFATSAATETS